MTDPDRELVTTDAMIEELQKRFLRMILVGLSPKTSQSGHLFVYWDKTDPLRTVGLLAAGKAVVLESLHARMPTSHDDFLPGDDN